MSILMEREAPNCLQSVCDLRAVFMLCEQAMYMLPSLSNNLNADSWNSHLVPIIPLHNGWYGAVWYEGQKFPSETSSVGEWSQHTFV